MNVGIGTSQLSQAFDAGVQACEMALQHYQAQDTPVCALLFCTGAMDAHGCFAGARHALGDSLPIYGGSAMGLISNELLLTEGPAAIVLLLGGLDVAVQGAVSTDIYRDPWQSGDQIANQLKATPDSQCLLLFYDSVRYAATALRPPVMVPSGPLLRGVHHQRLQHIPLFGAGLLGDGHFNLTWQFTGHAVQRHTATSLLFRGAFQPFHCVMHGCQTVSQHSMQVTGVYGQYLYSVDQRPVIEVLDALSHDPAWRHQAQDADGTPMPVTRLAIARAIDVEGLAEPQMVTRLISGVLPNNEGVVLFEPDLSEGEHVYLMERDPERMQASAAKESRALFAQIKQQGRQPLVAFYFDCGGRMATISGGAIEEASFVQQACQEYGVPLLGIYTGVEIAPIGSRSYGLDWSGVLLVLAH